MKKLLQQLEDYMVLKNYSLATQKAYLNAAENFYLWCETQQDIPEFDKENAHRRYLVHRHKSGLAWQTVNGDYSAIRMLYTKVLNRPWDEEKKFVSPKVYTKRKNVPSQKYVNISIFLNQHSTDI